MAYVTSWERIGYKHGLQQGIDMGKLKEKREILVRQMKRKFSLSREEERRILKTESLEKLDHALDRILLAETREEVLRELD